MTICRDPSALSELCRRHHLRRLALFDSTLSGTARPDSDVDLLVEFEAGATPGFIGMATIERELSALLDGQKVDLRTPNELRRYFRERVLRDSVAQYAA